ncbi:MAG: hypothetical protein NZ483_01560 [Verrucomicrobiae bacterium]|nr:hypothetical protein [Verrucomicrobiae bacterium]
MSARCGRCGYGLPVGAGRCPKCGALVQPPGWFQRVRDKLKRLVSAEKQPMVRADFALDVPVVYKRQESITVVDDNAGTTQHYRSLAELPPELRAKFEEALRGSQPPTTTEIVVEGPDGVRRTYKSWDEVPEPIRDLFARHRK